MNNLPGSVTLRGGVRDLNTLRSQERTPGPGCSRYWVGLNAWLSLLLLLGAVWPAAAKAQTTGPAPRQNVRAAVLREFPPQYSLDSQGHPTGFAIEVLDAIAPKAGLSIEYQLYDNWEEVIRAITSGQADLVPNIGVSEELGQRLDFTRPVETFNLCIFVRASTHDIDGLSDLAGRRAGAVLGGRGFRLLARVASVEVIPCQNAREGLFHLLAGERDAFVIVDPVMWNLAYLLGVEDRIKVAGPPLEELKRAMAVREGDDQLRDRLDQALAAFLNSPEYQDIYSRWHRGPQPFWTTGRVFLAMSLLLGLSMLGMGLWRHRTVMGINRRLQESLDEGVQARETLRQSEEKFLLAFKRAPIMAAITALEDGTYLEVNDKFMEASGFTAEGVLGHTSIEVGWIRAADRHRLIEMLHRQGRITDMEITSYARDGRPINCLYNCELVTIGGVRRVLTMALDITERKQAEERLKAARDEWRSTFDAISSAVWIMDEQFVIRRINKSTVDFLGKQPEEILGCHCWEVVHGASEPIADCPALRMLSSKQREEMEFLIGSRWLMSSVDPIFDGDGHIIQVVHILSDVTERKQAEEARRQSHELLDRVMANMSQGMVVADSQMKVIAFNEAVRSLSSLAEDELRLGSDFADIIEAWAKRSGQDEEMRTRALANLGRRQPYYVELSKKEMGRVPRWVLMCHNPLPDGGFVRTFTDVTELRRTEEALRQQQERYRLLVESANEGIVVAQGDHIKFFNSRFLEITGCSAPELINSPFIETVHPDDRDMILDRYQHRLKGDNVPTGYDFRILDKRGKVKWVFASSVIIEWDGSPATLNFFTDVTGRKQGEEERERLEAQLRQAQKMQAVGTLAGGVAHEFNNLLAAIMGYAELASDAAKEGECNPKDLEQIIKAAQRGRDLVLQILTFSRRQRRDLKPLNLNYEVDYVLEMLERTLPRTVLLEAELAPDLELVNADGNNLSQVLVNLATNAAHAMPDGGRIIFRTENISLDKKPCLCCGEPLSGPWVRLTVADDGQGMDQETLAQCFDPFFSTKEVGKGTGLGLSVVHGIVRSHDGHITCHSVVGMGTTIEILLPALARHDASQVGENVAKAPAGGNETILLVDDEEPLLQLGHRLLTGMGYEVVTASSGEEALDIYIRKQKSLHLIILDLGMPGMGGHNCLKAILEANPKAKIIVASGYASDAQVKETMDSGAIAFVAKPYKRADLLATVRSVLDRK